MELLKQISEHSTRNNIDFLVIGGHALNALGYDRQTADLDLLVRKADRTFWLETLQKLHYTQFQAHEVFARFKAKELAAWPVDLMFVDSAVFQQLYSAANKSDFGSIDALVPAVDHMIALKLHSLKQRQAHREQKDFNDLYELKKRSTISQADFCELCTKYDRIDIYEKFLTIDDEKED